MDKKTKKRIIRIVVTIILLCLAIFALDGYLNETGSLITYLVIYFIISNDVIQKAFHNILVGEIFDENFLMLIASVGAFFLGEYHEGIAVILLYQIGEVFEGIAVQRSKKSISSLLSLQSEEVHVLNDEGKLITKNLKEVPIGSKIIIKTGEKIPLDGVLLTNQAELDLSALTGESLPQTSKEGEVLASGAINLGKQIELETTANYNNSTITKMMKLVEEATNKKAASEQFITKFARYYTPIVISLAVLVAIVPLLFVGFDEWKTWLYRSLIFLVISCPCALVISVPLSFFAGIGGLSKKGILIKGNEYIESLTKVGAVVLDKTGTLTTGKFKVTKINSKNLSEDDLLQLVASVEQYSTHPIAKSIVEANTKDLLQVKEVNELSGHGVTALYNNKQILIGNEKLMTKYHILVEKVNEIGTVLYVAVADEYLGYIVISDPIKDSSYEAMEELGKLGIKRKMITGDLDKVARKVSQELQIDAYTSQCLPEDKVNEVKEVMKEVAPKKVLFAGDGLNDAPVIAMSDVGVAMGGVGSDIAIEAADVVIMDDDPTKIVQTLKSAKRILRIVKENITFALVVKFSFLFLAMFGLMTMEWAIFADVGVTIIAVLNAIRALKL